jgi:hypothetical protein
MTEPERGRAADDGGRRHRKPMQGMDAIATDQTAVVRIISGKATSAWLGLSSQAFAERLRDFSLFFFFCFQEAPHH